MELCIKNMKNLNKIPNIIFHLGQYIAFKMGVRKKLIILSVIMLICLIVFKKNLELNFCLISADAQMK